MTIRTFAEPNEPKGGIQDPTRHVLSVVLLVITDFIWVVQPHPGSPGMINSFLLVAIPCTPGSHPNDLLLISIRIAISYYLINLSNSLSGSINLSTSLSPEPDNN